MKCKDCKSCLCSYRTTDREKDCFYDIHKDYPLPIDMWQPQEAYDWEMYRRDVAKTIVASMVVGIGKWDDKILVRNALVLTDELIKQLKEK